MAGDGGGVGRNKQTNRKKVCFRGGKQTFSTGGETIVKGLQNKGFRGGKVSFREVKQTFSRRGRQGFRNKSFKTRVLSFRNKVFQTKVRKLVCLQPRPDAWKLFSPCEQVRSASAGVFYN